MYTGCCYDPFIPSHIVLAFKEAHNVRSVTRMERTNSQSKVEVNSRTVRSHRRTLGGTEYEQLNAEVTRSKITRKGSKYVQREAYIEKRWALSEKMKMTDFVLSSAIMRSRGERQTWRKVVCYILRLISNARPIITCLKNIWCEMQMF